MTGNLADETLPVHRARCSLLGCGSRVEQFVLPDQVTDFPANSIKAIAAGCHGHGGRSPGQLAR